MADLHLCECVHTASLHSFLGIQQTHTEHFTKCQGLCWMLGIPHWPHTESLLLGCRPGGEALWHEESHRYILIYDCDRLSKAKLGVLRVIGKLISWKASQKLWLCYKNLTKSGLRYGGGGLHSWCVASGRAGRAGSLQGQSNFSLNLPRSFCKWGNAWGGFDVLSSVKNWEPEREDFLCGLDRGSSGFTLL